MAGYFLAAEDATSWPDAVVLVAAIAAFVFLMWLVLR